MKSSVLLPPVYQIEEGPFRGGMGSVYRVLHREWGTQLAVKQPLPELLDNKRALELFLSECRLWVMLGMHEHIVMCHYVRTLQGVPTVFAEWMPGGDLQTRIASGLLYNSVEACEGTETDDRTETDKRTETDDCTETDDRAETDERAGTDESAGTDVLSAQKKILDIGIQIARGMAYAHSRGLIHRDLKPANILFAGDGTAKVTDFGLALLRGSGADATVGFGTAAYAAPEQHQKKEVGPAADLWSFGVILLEMFLGERRWKNSLFIPAGLKIWLSDPAVPVPERARDLILRCCDPIPSGRPSGFREVIDSLKDCWRILTGREYPRRDTGESALIADTWNNRALSYLDLEMETDAEECWQKALRADPGHMASLYNLSMYRWRTAGIDDLEVMRLLQNACNNEPTRENAVLLAGFFTERASSEPIRRLCSIYGGDLVPGENIGRDRRSLIMSKRARSLSVSGPEAVFLFADRTAELWNLTENRRIALLRTEGARLLDALILPDGTVCAGSREGLSIFSRDGERKDLIPVPEGTVRHLFLCGQGNEILVHASREDTEGNERITRHYAIRLDPSTGRRRFKLRFEAKAGEAGKAEKEGGLRKDGDLRKDSNIPIDNHSGKDGRASGFFVPLRDGRELLIPTEKGLLRVDPARGRIRQTYLLEKESAGTNAEKPEFSCAAASPDETLLAACAGDTLWLWDLADGKLLTHFPVKRCSTLTFVRRGSASSPGSAFSDHSRPGIPSGNSVFTKENSGLTKDSSGLTEESSGCEAFYLLSAGQDPEVRLWELPNGRCLRSFAPHRGGVQCMRMAGQDAFLSAGDLDGVYCQHIPVFGYKALWKLCRAEETRRLREDEDRFRELIYRAADLWKKGSRKQALENLYQARSIHGYERNQTYLRLNAAMGKSLRICSLQNVWSRGSDRADDRIVRALPEDSRDPCRCTDQKSGRSLLARFEGDILIREPDGTRRTIRTGRRGVCAAALSGDGKRSSLAFFDGKLIMLDNREGRICWERSGGHMATRLCFDPAGVFLLAGREDGTILVHDPDDGRILKVLTGRKSSVTAMVFSEDGQFLRSDTEDGGVRIWQFDYKYTCD